VRRAVAAEANEAGETPLLAAAERGHLGAVVELLRHLDAEAVAAKNRSGYDALHVAAREGHHGEISVSSTATLLCCELRFFSGK
jgi:ankyrin repeat protein